MTKGTLAQAQTAPLLFSTKLVKETWFCVLRIACLIIHGVNLLIHFFFVVASQRKTPRLLFLSKYNISTLLFKNRLQFNEKKEKKQSSKVSSCSKTFYTLTKRSHKYYHFEVLVQNRILYALVL